MNPRLILLVDDDPDDLMLIKEAIGNIDGKYQFEEFTDARKALSHLRSLDAIHKHPCLIVLDINMPVLGGREMLAMLKSDPGLNHIPIVVFSTSSNPADVEYCKQFNVELISKPFDMTQLIEAARRLITYCSTATN
jgi:CheY-like chemotaxis protein